MPASKTPLCRLQPQEMPAIGAGDFQAAYGENCVAGCNRRIVQEHLSTLGRYLISLSI